MEKLSLKEKVNDFIYFLLKLSAYIILPLIGMIARILISSSMINGNISTSVDSISGLFETIVIFSVPMLLFLAFIPLLVKIKIDNKSLNDLGLVFIRNKKNIIILTLNILILVAVIFSFCTSNAFNSSEIPAMILHILAIGISEEIMLRSIVYDEVHSKFNTVISVIITSLIFAFIYHSGSDWQSNLLIRFPLGVILSILRIKTNNIYSSILFHSWYNMLVLIL